MKQLIECSTCGYPLLPEERANLVEIDGKMCKPVADHSERDLDMVTAPPQLKPLTDDEIDGLMADTWGGACIAPQSAPAFARAIERAHGIGGEE